MVRPTLLTQEIQDEIVRYTMSGSFAHVAAAAVGISTDTFLRWMRQGRLADQWEPPEGAHPFTVTGRRVKCTECQQRADAPDHAPVERPDEQQWVFWQEVSKARALARISMESMIAQAAADDWRAAEVWLKRGPGRHKGDEDPGWADRVEVTHEPPDEAIERIIGRVAAELDLPRDVVLRAGEAVANRVAAATDS